MVIQTLLPQSQAGSFFSRSHLYLLPKKTHSFSATSQYTFGHLLIVGYLSKDIVASWCSSIALSHVIADNQQFKEAILQVVLAVDPSQPDVKTLMDISVDLLQNVELPLVFFPLKYPLCFA